MSQKKAKNHEAVKKADRICTKHAERYVQTINRLSRVLGELENLSYTMRAYNSDNNIGPGKQENFNDDLDEFIEKIEELLMNNPELP